MPVKLDGNANSDFAPSHIAPRYATTAEKVRNAIDPTEQLLHMAPQNIAVKWQLMRTVGIDGDAARKLAEAGMRQAVITSSPTASRTTGERFCRAARTSVG